MGSIWSMTQTLPAQAELKHNISVDAAVIGGGMAGILTAFLLKEQGVDVAVLEANAVGSGQTANTTAKITSQHGLIYDKLIGRFGREGAAQYAAANQAALHKYRELIGRNGIACDLETLPAFLYSTQTKDKLEREAEAAKELGLPASYTTAARLPFPVAGAVRFDEQAQFHPLKFLAALLPGLTVYENARVSKVEGDTVYAGEHAVRAKHIVFACHFPFVNTPGWYFMRMHQERSYVVALRSNLELGGMYLSVDEGGLSLRAYDGLVLLGGGGHRTGDNRAGGKYALLREAAKRYFPGAEEVAHWSAQDCMPLDNVPYIGRFAHDAPGWYVATGFQKWGMTSSMAAAMILSELILGRENPNAGIFSPARYVPAAAIPAALKDGAEAVKGLTRELLRVPQKTLHELPVGHGGVVLADGEKTGIYKEEDGGVYAVPTRCPHLGCELTFNPDEKSWDCPCHGSRFDHTGKLLDGPAQEDLGAQLLR